MTDAVVIAVDGPVAAGKGTLGRRLADRLGLRHLDSGMLYRATAALLVESGGDPADPEASRQAAERVQEADLHRGGLRGQETGLAASRIAAHAGVREVLLDFQRRFAARPPGAVIDGRDIGTIVCPAADVKLFVTASLEARAARRHLELAARNEDVRLHDVAAEIAERDRRDTKRVTAPLRQADDAVLLDTSDLDADQALAAALKIVNARLRTDPDCASQLC